MKIAVTGGSGGMGRSLIPYLLEKDHEVISLDRTLPANSQQRTHRNLIVEMTDFGQVVVALDSCDAVIHLAAHPSPMSFPEPVVYQENTVGSYNVLAAAGVLGIKRVCMASSINAIGGVYSREARYDYFPVDEEHPTYAEDAYSLSKWVLERQGDAFARRYEWMTIASLRFHWLVDTRERVMEMTTASNSAAVRHLWAYTLFSAANRSCLQSITADFQGHEAFYIVAPRTAVTDASRDLIQTYYPDTALNSEMPGDAGFFDCSKAERLLNWKHEA